MQKWACIHPDRHEAIRSFREWAKSLPLEERKRIDGFKFFCEKGVWRWECIIRNLYDNLIRNTYRIVPPTNPIPSREETPLSVSVIRSAVETLRHQTVRPDRNELYYAPPVVNVPRGWGETISVDGSTSIDVSIPASQTVQENAFIEWGWNPDPVTTDNTDVPF